MNTQELEIFPDQRGHSLFIDSQQHCATVEDHNRLINLIEYIGKNGSILAESLASKENKDSNGLFDSEYAAIQYIYRLKNLHLIEGKKTGPFSLPSELPQIIIKNYLQQKIASTLTIRNIHDVDALLIASDRLLVIGKIINAIMMLESLEFNPKLPSNIRGRVFARLADLNSIIGEYPTSITYAKKALIEIGERRQNVLRAFIHEIAARSYYYMGGDKNLREALKHIKLALDCWIKKDARRAEQLALQARILAAIDYTDHTKIANHYDKAYSIIEQESKNKHERMYLKHLTDYNRLCYYISCSEQGKFTDECSELLASTCSNIGYAYTPSEWFDLKEAECLFNYYTLKNDPDSIKKSAAEALDFAAQAKLHGPRIKYIKQIFREMNGTSEDLKNATNRNKQLISRTALCTISICPMCLEFTHNDRLEMACYCQIN